MADDPCTTIERLYAAGPERVVAERTRLARELKEGGHRDAAERLGGERKPAPVR